MTVDDFIAEAAKLPLRDAAYLLWRQKATFERLEGRSWPKRDMSTPEARERAMREISTQIHNEHDFAQDGPTFERLKRAHPTADDTEAKQAIVAAVKFDDDCFRYFPTASTTIWRTSMPLWRGRQGTTRHISKPPTAMPVIGSLTT